MVDEDRLLEVALEAGADDVSASDSSFEVVTPPENYNAVRAALDKAKIPVLGGEITLEPDNTVRVSGHTAEQVFKLVEELEDHDDAQSVAANFDILDDELARLSA